VGSTQPGEGKRQELNLDANPKTLQPPQLTSPAISTYRTELRLRRAIQAKWKKKNVKKMENFGDAGI
jgi:hypothetical protein